METAKKTLLIELPFHLHEWDSRNIRFQDKEIRLPPKAKPE